MPPTYPSAAMGVGTDVQIVALSLRDTLRADSHDGLEVVLLGRFRDGGRVPRGQDK